MRCSSTCSAAQTRTEVDSAATGSKKDKRVLALVKAFLRAGILTELGEIEDTHTGTPQGGGATRGRTFMSGSRWLEVRLMPGT